MMTDLALCVTLVVSEELLGIAAVVLASLLFYAAVYMRQGLAFSRYELAWVGIGVMQVAVFYTLVWMVEHGYLLSDLLALVAVSRWAWMWMILSMSYAVVSAMRRHQKQQQNE